MTTPAVASRRSRLSRAIGYKHVSLRRGMLVLIIAALLPITLLAILQGLVRLENRRAAIVRQLSNNAAALADSNATILGATESLLRIIALNPVVRKGEAGCGAALVAARAATPSTANLLRYDADGRLLCAATAPDRPYVIPDRNWWATVAASERVQVSEAVWGPFSKRRVAMMVLPLRAADGSFDGTMTAAIDLAWLRERLRTRLRGDTTGVAIISDSGQVLIASPGLPMFDPRTAPGQVARVRDGDGRMWSYTLVPLVTATPGQLGLHVVYAEPEPPRFGVVWWQTIVDFALPVLAIALASLAIWVGTERLVLRWLLALQRLALHFAGGDYRRRPVTFRDAPRELRSVAASLYRMSGAVSERDRRLREALERQRLLAREVHHRVKNNFQIVVSLLSLQATRLGDTEARRAIDQARRRIGALALVHRLLYDSGELGNISSRTLLGALCDQLQPRGDSGLTLSCDFDDVPLDIDSAVPLTLWLVESINNAFHHAFPHPATGHVDATFRVVGDSARLTISDNGIGFDADSVSATGQGLRLIRALATQLGGSATVRPCAGGGSEASLDFPLPPVARLAAANDAGPSASAATGTVEAADTFRVTTPNER